ncbi:site-specific DNA-methyltransferase [Paenibacillus sp. FSL W8-0919]|uniref:DNA-methyltransferase n=1 Tax=Paenibacillus sp. FSL W8-0919 TaxID=2954707 RepID=UPI0030FAE39E
MPQLEAESFHTCVTSPPYFGLRDYGLKPTYWPEVTYTPMPGLPPMTVSEWTGCLGLEPTPEMFVAHMVLVFREVWRLLRKDGTLWLNYGDSYAAGGNGGGGAFMDERRAWKGRSSKNGWRKPPEGLKRKDLVGIPWRVAFALQADGWYLRMDNVWNKTNPMPESVRDRPTKAHEYIFLLAKSERYYYDRDAVLELLAETSVARLAQNVEAQQGSKRAAGGAKVNGAMKALFSVRGSRGVYNKPLNSARRNGEKPFVLPKMRNRRSVFTGPTASFTEAHFAVFPEWLIKPCILAGAPVGGRVLDPFGGSGTTLKVALENNRECTIIEMGPQYVEIAERRTAVIQPTLNI